MSHNASAHALRQRLPGAAMEKWLLFNLGDRADDWGGSIFMGYETLEDKTEMSRSSLKRAFRNLIKKHKLLELELPSTPVSPPFYRMVGVPPPAQVKRQDETCPLVLRRAAILIFLQRCEFCGRQGMKEWGPDGKHWQIVQLEPDKYAGRPTPDNITLACQTCERKKDRSLEGVRSLVVRQRERAIKRSDPSLFDEAPDAPDGGGQVDPSCEGGGDEASDATVEPLGPSVLDEASGARDVGGWGQVDPGVGSTWPEGGVNLDRPPALGGVKLDPDPCTDPSNDPDPGAARREDPAVARADAARADPLLSPEGPTRNQKQRRENARAATRDVATERGWGRKWPDRAAREADLATMPMQGRMASAPKLRLLGYEVFDADPAAGHDELSRRLYALAIVRKLATSQEACRDAMADVYLARAPRDRHYDRGADRDRRARR